MNWANIGSTDPTSVVQSRVSVSLGTHLEGTCTQFLLSSLQVLKYKLSRTCLPFALLEVVNYKVRNETLPSNRIEQSRTVPSIISRPVPTCCEIEKRTWNNGQDVGEAGHVERASKS